MKPFFFRSFQSKKKESLNSPNRGNPVASREKNYWVSVGGLAFNKDIPSPHHRSLIEGIERSAQCLAHRNVSPRQLTRNYRICRRQRSLVDVLAEDIVYTSASLLEWEEAHDAVKAHLLDKKVISAAVEPLILQCVYSRICATSHLLSWSSLRFPSTHWPLLNAALKNYVLQHPFSLSVGQVWSRSSNESERVQLDETDRPLRSSLWASDSLAFLSLWAELISCLAEPGATKNFYSGVSFAESLYNSMPLRHIATHAPVSLGGTINGMSPTFYSTLSNLERLKAKWTKGKSLDVLLEPYSNSLSSHFRLIMQQVAGTDTCSFISEPVHMNECIAAVSATLLLINYVDRKRMHLPERFRDKLLPMLKKIPTEKTLMSNTWIHLEASRVRDFVLNPGEFLYTHGLLFKSDSLTTTLKSENSPPITTTTRGIQHTPAQQTARNTTKKRYAKQSSKLASPTKTARHSPPPMKASDLHCTLNDGANLVVRPGESLYLQKTAGTRDSDQISHMCMYMEDVGDHLDKGSGVFSYTLYSQDDVQVLRHFLGVSLQFANTELTPVDGLAFDFVSGTIYTVKAEEWANMGNYTICGLDTPMIQRRHLPATYSLSCNRKEVIFSAQQKIRGRRSWPPSLRTNVPKSARFFVIIQFNGLPNAKLAVRTYQDPPSNHKMHFHLMDAPWKAKPGSILFSESFHCRKIGFRESDAFMRNAPIVQPFHGAVVPGSVVRIKRESTGEADEESERVSEADASIVTPEKANLHVTRRHKRSLPSPKTRVLGHKEHPRSRIERVEVAVQIWKSLLRTAATSAVACPFCDLPEFGVRYYARSNKSGVNKTMESLAKEQSTRRNDMIHTSSKTLRLLGTTVICMESGALGRLQKFRHSEATRSRA